MGLDYLDLIFRVEKEFKVRISQADLEEMGRVQPDVPASAVLELLVTRPTCPSCGYSLRGHGVAGMCPECGGSFVFDSEETWERLRRILAAVTRLDPVKISRESLLVRDLGFT